MSSRMGLQKRPRLLRHPLCEGHWGDDAGLQLQPHDVRKLKLRGLIQTVTVMHTNPGGIRATFGLAALHR